MTRRIGILEQAVANIHRYSMPGAGIYDRVTGLLFQARYAEIADDVASVVTPGSRVLDVGCGPGTVVVDLARRLPSLALTGLDLDEPMIARANRKAARLPAGSRPAFVVADAAAMPFADGSFDLVVSSFAMHHWPDPHAGLAEMLRVLRPGGRLLIWDIAPPGGHGAAAPEETASAHGSGPRVVVVRDGTGDGHAAPRPSLLGTLRTLLLFRRLPMQRYEFTKPAA